jgi:formylmethanofuran dehydrogenase subunit E
MRKPNSGASTIARATTSFAKDPTELFEQEPVQVEMPPKAQIEPSKLCDICGEPTMASKLSQKGDSLLCHTCMEKHSGA